MKKLKLQINAAHFQEILEGNAKVEERFVYPNNVDRYVTESDNPDGTVTITPIPYDCIEFSCGRSKNARKMTVAVKEAQFIVLTDENGEDMTYEENGVEYVVCQVWYTLGKISDVVNA